MNLPFQKNIEYIIMDSRDIKRRVSVISLITDRRLGTATPSLEVK